MGSNILQIPSSHNPLSKPPKLYLEPLANRMTLHSSIAFESYQKWQLEYPPSNYNSEFLLLPKKHQLIHKTNRRNFNSNHPSSQEDYEVEVEFDCFPYVMEDEIENRKQLGKKFEETEIWYVLLGLVEGCWEVGMKGICRGVNGRSIVFNEIGEIKIVGGWSWPANPEQIELIENETVYQAPEALYTKNPYNPEKSLTFSIAITILSLLFTQSYHTLYTPVFSEESLNRLLQLVPTLTYKNSFEKQCKYSFDLIRILERMACISLEERLWLGELKDILSGVRDQIIKFEDFTINWSAYHSGISTPARQLESLIHSPVLTPRNHIILNSYKGNVINNVIQPKPEFRQHEHFETIPQKTASIIPLYSPIQLQHMHLHFSGKEYIKENRPGSNILFHDLKGDGWGRDMAKGYTFESTNQKGKVDDGRNMVKEQNMDPFSVDDELLARVERQLERSKFLFPN